MTWKTVRLELAPTPAFPRGSASRAYLLRVPLDDQGMIDEAALAERNSLATARRFWSSEADQFGHVERTDGHWLIRCITSAGETISRMAVQPLRPDGEVLIEGPDGASNLFRVVSIHTIRMTGAAKS
jgi:hypothetical protein